MDRATRAGRANSHIVILRYGSGGSAVRELLKIFHPQTGFFVTVREATESQGFLAFGEAPGSVFAILLVPGPGQRESVDRTLRVYRESTSTTPLIVAADEHVEPECFLSWLQEGAWDFLTPPFTAASVLPRLWRLSAPLTEEDQSVSRLKEKLGLTRILGQNPEFLSQIRRIPIVARCSASVLIQGETGTGKELIARSIHHLSPRCNHPFVAVSCAGIPEGLAENELWGHVKGAFTGASHQQQGLVAEANMGTLLLDDVDRLTPAIQAKLLRFLQEQEYRMLGSPRLHHADVRVIASSILSLLEETKNGHFRLDLYHRLNVVPIDLPPLRERVEDIPLLARHFLVRHSEEMGVPAPKIPARVMDLLLMYDWPGNVRELEHVIQRALILRKGPMLDASNLMIPLPDADRGVLSFQQAKAAVIRRFERRYLERQLSTHAGNVSHAARASGKHRRAFFELIRKHDIDVGRFRA